MEIKSLEIERFRNLSKVSIKTDAQLNVIHGSNGAGKTSLLEAIYCLARMESFRTSQIRNLRQDGSDDFLLRATTTDRIQHGVKWDGGWACRRNRETIRSRREWSEKLPIVVFAPQQYQLIDGEPAVRRQFLDWSMFHVEHAFADTFARFRRSLLQRNTLLKTQRRTDANWDSVFIEASHALHQCRQLFVDELSVYFLESIDQLLPGAETHLELRAGWDRKKGLDTALADAEPTDVERGFTSLGPQRADLVIRARQSRMAREAMSRGQQRMVLLSLQLAYMRLAAEKTQDTVCGIFDDVWSELDQAAEVRLRLALESAPGQIWITQTSPQSRLSQENNGAVFHVEHGEVEREH